jgi:hypothetical protein
MLAVEGVERVSLTYGEDRTLSIQLLSFYPQPAGRNNPHHIIDQGLGGVGAGGRGWCSSLVLEKQMIF